MHCASDQETPGLQKSAIRKKTRKQRKTKKTGSVASSNEIRTESMLIAVGLHSQI